MSGEGRPVTVAAEVRRAAAGRRAPVPAPTRHGSAGRRLQIAALVAAVGAVLAWSLGPAVWQVLTAFKPDEQITRAPTVYLPHPAVWTHVAALWERKPFGRYLANSTWISAWATLLCLALAAPAASVLARARGVRRIGPLFALLAISLFPPILLLFPLYEGVRTLGWINHSMALIVPYAAIHLPLAVWLIESGIRAIPRELDDAASLDGLGGFARLWTIHLPLAGPAVAAAAVLVFILCWNEFMLALTFMTRDAGKTVTAGIASVSGASYFEVPWGQLSAAILLATLPLVLVAFACERWIVAGITGGAVRE